MSDPEDGQGDWSLATFDGARREQMRRWSELPLERIIAAIEEMGDLARRLGADPAPHTISDARPE